MKLSKIMMTCTVDEPEKAHDVLAAFVSEHIDELGKRGIHIRTIGIDVDAERQNLNARSI